MLILWFEKMIRIFFTVVWHLPCPISQETFTVFQAVLTIMLVNASASANKLGIFGNQKIRNKLFFSRQSDFFYISRRCGDLFGPTTHVPVKSSLDDIGP